MDAFYTTSRLVGRLVTNDNTFGPVSESITDFTLVFENCVFTILPTSIIMAACPAYVMHYLNAAPVAQRTKQFWAKAVCFPFRPFVSSMKLI